MSFAIDTFHPERFGLVTGSKCSVMFPLKGDGVVGMTTYAKHLANERFFQFYDEKSSWEMDHGKMGQHFATLHYQDYFGELQSGRWVKNGDCGGNTDAETETKVIDFKCPTSLKKWLDYLYDPIDKEQKDQLQMYMYLTRKDEAEIAAYLTETQFMTDNGLTYPVPEEKRMIIVKVEKDKTWEERLNEQLPFVITMREKYIQILNNKFN
jgi:hypothetical protein